MNSVRQTICLRIPKRVFQNNNVTFGVPDKIANTIRDRIAEAGLEKFADITKKFENKYQILDFVGEGNSGLVKQCLNRETHKVYAVKIVRSNDIEVLKGIKGEFLLQKNLSHPSIVKVYEMFYNPIASRTKIIMELVKGNELFDIIQNKGPFEGMFLQ